jgi:hypothetical protein
MTINPQPEFAPAVRGYDRQQVDDYVQILLQYIAEVKRQRPQAPGDAATPMGREMAGAASPPADPTPPQAAHAAPQAEVVSEAARAGFHRIMGTARGGATMVAGPVHDGSAFLSYCHDAGRVHRVKLAAPGRYSIGRHSHCDIRLDWDDTVSRLHARLDLVGSDWILTDDGSSNGTFVNGRRLCGYQRLCDRDVVRAGLTNLTFSAGGCSGAGARPAPAKFRPGSPPSVPTPRTAADREP